MNERTEALLQIDPYAWLFTVPLTLALAQLAIQPGDRALKRIWRHLGEMETAALEQMGCDGLNLRCGPGTRVRRAIFTCVLCGLAVASAASLMAFIASARLV